MTIAVPPSWPRIALRRRLWFALVPLAVLVLASEIAVRLWRAREGAPLLHLGSYRELRLDQIRRCYPAVHDAALGYVPRPDVHSEDNLWRAMISIDHEGLRRNGAVPPPGDRCVLAVGDSFTFGDQVGDAETWPARLEAELQRPVRNAGVWGYSLGQTVLRAEALLEHLPVDWVVASFIADDLARCELSRRYAAVPWFELVDDQLVLRNVPVPQAAAGRGPGDMLSRQWLGYSALADLLGARLSPRWWIEEESQERALPPGTGRLVGRKLVERLADACARHHARLLLVLQGDRAAWDATEVMEHARHKGIRTLDLASRFEQLAKADPSLVSRFFAIHMTAAGNRWVATQIAAELEGR